MKFNLRSISPTLLILRTVSLSLSTSSLPNPYSLLYLSSINTIIFTSLLSAIKPLVIISILPLYLSHLYFHHHRRTHFSSYPSSYFFTASLILSRIIYTFLLPYLRYLPLSRLSTLYLFLFSISSKNTINYSLILTV